MGQCENVTQLHYNYPERWSQDDYISELSPTFTTDCAEMTSRVLLLTSVNDDSMRRIFEVAGFYIFFFFGFFSKTVKTSCI